MKSRVRIGTCSGPADAALVRSVFEAHEIQVLIGAEHHASMLGGLGGAFVRLDIIVDEADAEEAFALLHDIREGDHATSDDDAEEPEAEPDDPERDERDDAEGVWGGGHPEQPEAELPGAASIALVTDRRRRTAIALLLTVTIGFGTAHMYTRAWLRGLVLAGVGGLGVALFAGSPGLGAALIVGARIADAFGAVSRIWSLPPPTPPSELPPARIHDG
jgi:Putative prokaryotic signal transducing protein